MKNIKYLTVLFFLIILGCGSDESLENPETTEEPPIQYSVSNISPLLAKIGDTIKLTGTNLNKLEEVFFLHEDRVYYQDTIKVRSFSYITKNENEITLKIPEVFHEKVLVEFPDTNNFKLEIVGMIPVLSNFEHVDHIQIIDKNTVFLMDRERIYKSTDGFYKWEVVYEPPNGYDITSFYYLNKNDCWIALGGTDGVSIHYSDNSGTDFKLFHQIHDTYSGKWIRNMKFFSLSKGFFVDNNQEMYVSENNSFQNIYDYFPKLGDLPFGKIEIWNFSAINENLIFLAPNETASLIKIDNENITSSEFDIWPSPPLLFNDIGYVQVNDYIYKTIDLGNSWTKLKTFDHDYTRIHFWNNQEGFAFAPSPPAEMHLTKDGGTTWKKYFTFPQYHRAHHKDFTEINGLIGSANGRLWKYRKE